MTAKMVKSTGDGQSAPPDVDASFPGEELECKICYNFFDLENRTPKLLGCSHTFCEACLDVLHSQEGKGWRIVCPVCRQRSPVPDNRIQNLPDNTSMTVTLELKTHEPRNSQTSLVQNDVIASPVSSGDEGGGSCHACERVAFATGCVCAILSYLSTALLLFLGLVFVHNFNDSTPAVGISCLFAASLLALLSLILTWLMCVCVWKCRADTESSGFTSLCIQ